MSGFLDRYRNTLLGLAIMAGLATLFWLDDQRGRVAEGRAPPPSLELARLAGGDPIRLESLHGAPVVLDFWASWCGPCRASLPELDRLAEQYAGRVRFFAVNAEGEPAEVQQALWTQLGLKLEVLSDGAALSQALGVQMLPTTVILGKDGRVVTSLVGTASSARIAASVDAALSH